MAEPFNTPVPGATPVMGTTPRATSPVADVPPLRPIVLHIGDEVRYNPQTFAEFAARFTVVRPSLAERQRPAFMQALREGRWGPFAAIFRPFWGSGGEMGRWDDELVRLLPASCRIFASAGAGFDWADTEALGKKGIIYCNAGLAAADAVADFAVAMVISTFRHLTWCMGAATLRAADAHASSPTNDAEAFAACHALATAQSHNLRGHVLGLVGMGNIGQKIAARLGGGGGGSDSASSRGVSFGFGLGMRVHYYDVVRQPAAVEHALGAVYHDSLADLLRVADCVVLCTPASPDGRPLLTCDALAAMKPAARFVNVARGSLVDEEALADALEDGRLAAAALDVHATEPHVHPRLLRLALPVSSDTTPTVTYPRVFLTCHNAGGTVETHVGFEELSMRNIMAVLEGRPPLTPVNLHHLVT